MLIYTSFVTITNDYIVVLAGGAARSEWSGLSPEMAAGMPGPQFSCSRETRKILYWILNTEYWLLYYTMIWYSLIHYNMIQYTIICVVCRETRPATLSGRPPFLGASPVRLFCRPLWVRGPSEAMLYLSCRKTPKAQNEGAWKSGLTTSTSDLFFRSVLGSWCLRQGEGKQGPGTGVPRTRWTVHTRRRYAYHDLGGASNPWSWSPSPLLNNSPRQIGSDPDVASILFEPSQLPKTRIGNGDTLLSASPRYDRRQGRRMWSRGQIYVDDHDTGRSSPQWPGPLDDCTLISDFAILCQGAEQIKYHNN